MKIGFIYNHDAGHQLAHSLPIMEQMLTRFPDYQIDAIYSVDALKEQLSKALTRSKNANLIRIDIPWYMKIPEFLLRKVFPFKRMATLKANRDLFASYDVLVSPERMILFLKQWMKDEVPLLVHTKHGAGDRAQGFSSELAEFDLVLLPGKKHYTALVEDLKVLRRDQAAVIGYSKFDTIDFEKKKNLKFFDNDKPTVVYNPHLEPRLSSWYEMGEDVLEYFYNQDKYNLIFAPHIMLYRRRIHTSLAAKTVSWRKDLPEKYYKCPHIKIDPGSPNSLDMSYTLSADIYIGDVSSQVYEFTVEPRPIIFLNPYKHNWQDSEDFRFWHFGPVIEQSSQLEAAIEKAVADKGAYQEKQQDFFDLTFDLQDKPSSLRAAEAISDFLHSQKS